MDARSERAAEVGRAIVREARAENVTFMAGSIAYHAFVSMLPLLLFVLTVLATIGNAGLEGAVIGIVEAMLTPEASAALVDQLRQAGSATGLSVLGGLVLLWGTLRIFRGLDTAFSDIYETEAENTFVDQVTDGLLVLVTATVAIVAAVAVQAWVPLYGSGLLVSAFHWLLMVAGLGAALYPMYYVFPDTDVSAIEVLPGVLLAAVGLTTFVAAFRLYVEVGGRASPNLLVNVLLLLTFLYFAGLIVLLGVVVNAVLSNRSRDVSIDPVVGGLARGERRELADREVLLDGLGRVERLLAGANSFVIEAGGETVELHPPAEVTTDVESTLAIDDSITLELRWTPEEG